MIILFLILPVLITSIFTFIRVRQKASLTGEIIYHISFQTIIAYLITYIFFFQGFIPVFYALFISIGLLVLISLFYFIKDTPQAHLIDNVNKLEGIKNNILITLVTIFPLYIFLTIFRYLPGYLQILLSIILVLVVLIIYILIRKTMEKFYQNFKDWFIESGGLKYAIIWGLFGLLLMGGFFMQLPTNKLSQSLNLNNNAQIYAFDGLPIDIKNNYEQNNLKTLTLETELIENVYDYYYNDEYLYLTYENFIAIYNANTNELEKTLSLTYDEEYLENEDLFTEHFIFNDNQLYFFSFTGLYALDDLTITKISDFNFNDSKLFISSDGGLNLLNKRGNIYEIYSVDSTVLTLTETIDLSSSVYDELLVISNTLFYRNITEYILYDDLSVYFPDVSGTKIYNRELELMYFLKENTFYVNDGYEVKEIVTYKNNDYIGANNINDQLMIRVGNKFDESKIVIYNEDFLYLFNHLDHDTFFKINDYERSYIANYRTYDDSATFLQIETKEDKTLMTIYELYQVDQDIHLPFYSHYGIFSLLILLVAILIPITDDIKYVTYIDFESRTKQK